MIDDLDKTLEELLRHELPPDLVSQVSISFATPDNQFPGTAITLPAIDLFLYDVRENRDLRSNEWQIERQSNGVALKVPPPARVDCSYLITVWPSESTPNPARDEHRLLGEVMKVLLRHPTLPDSLLQGELHGQEIPPPATSLQAGQLQSMAEFWQALGGKPKAVLNYVVTIAVEVSKPVEAGPPVIDSRLKFKLGAQEG